MHIIFVESATCIKQNLHGGLDIIKALAIGGLFVPCGCPHTVAVVSCNYDFTAHFFKGG